MAFNKTTVENFYDKFSEVRTRHPSFEDGSRIYNLDETCTSTVQNVRKILSPKGVKQVHKVKGAERGVSVTTCVIINAHGSVLPPVHIFPRKKYVPDLLINCFPGALGLGNEKGYMTKESFYQVMEFFIKCTASTKESPTLLTLDNVETHFSTKTLDLAKEHGVTVFTFPPHCTHKLQPLDVGFFGPFKTYYDNAVDMFLLNNPATPPTIYRIAGFVKDALSKAGTPMNIIRSFEATGLVPFNRDIFTEADFIMATVTEKPAPDVGESVPENSTLESDDTATLRGVDSTTVDAAAEKEEPSVTAGESSTPFLGPVDIRGFPKAKQNENKRKRRKGKCMVATDTPERNEIMEREAIQVAKKKKSEEYKKKKLEKGVSKAAGMKTGPEKKRQNASKKTATQRRLVYASSEESDAEKIDDVLPPSPKPSSSKASKKKTSPAKKNRSTSNKKKEKESETEQVLDVEPSPKPNFPPLPRAPTEGDYVLVQFSVKDAPTFFVGKIIEDLDSDNDLQISYLRKNIISEKSVSFCLPPVPDLNSVHIDDVKIILPKPTFTTGTRRQNAMIIFNYDFSSLKLG